MIENFYLWYYGYIFKGTNLIWNQITFWMHFYKKLWKISKFCQAFQFRIFWKNLEFKNNKNIILFIILKFSNKYPYFFLISKLILKIPKFIWKIWYSYTKQNSGIFRILYIKMHYKKKFDFIYILNYYSCCVRSSWLFYVQRISEVAKHVSILFTC